MPYRTRPRVALAHLPTPLAPLDRLRGLLGADCPQLLIKRDDCTGLATGGNKTRKLEYLLGQALADGADTIVTSGAIQSNHVRQTAAACAALDLECHALLIDMVDRRDDAYRSSGNCLLDGLLGAQLHRVGRDQADGYREALVGRLRAAGRRPWIVPIGGSSPIGALGYVAAFDEIARQAAAAGIRVDAIVHGSSSGGTQAGLIAGAALAGSAVRILGVNVYKKLAEDVAADVAAVARATVEMLGGDPAAVAARLEMIHGYQGSAYGQPSAEMHRALTLLARSEGVLLDPVYSGKAFAALLGEIARGAFGRDETIVFLHTGGAAALPAYAGWLSEQMDS